MKYNGTIEKLVSIQQYEGGYVVMDTRLGGRTTKIFSSFEDAVNELAKALDLVDINERVVLSATREPKKTSQKATCDN